MPATDRYLTSSLAHEEHRLGRPLSDDEREALTAELIAGAPLGLRVESCGARSISAPGHPLATKAGRVKLNRAAAWSLDLFPVDDPVLARLFVVIALDGDPANVEPFNLLPMTRPERRAQREQEEALGRALTHGELSALTSGPVTERVAAAVAFREEAIARAATPERAAARAERAAARRVDRGRGRPRPRLTSRPSS